jgi:hypothetical protein
MRYTVAEQKFARPQGRSIVGRSENVQSLVTSVDQQLPASDQCRYPLLAYGRIHHEQVPQLGGIEPNYLAVLKSACIGEGGPASEQPNIPGESTGVMDRDLPLGRARTIENAHCALYHDDAINRIVSHPKQGCTRRHVFDTTRRDRGIEFSVFQTREGRIGFCPEFYRSIRWLHSDIDGLWFSVDLNLAAQVFAERWMTFAGRKPG